MGIATDAWSRQLHVELAMIAYAFKDVYRPN